MGRDGWGIVSAKFSLNWEKGDRMVVGVVFCIVLDSFFFGKNSSVIILQGCI